MGSVENKGTKNGIEAIDSNSIKSLLKNYLPCVVKRKSQRTANIFLHLLCGSFMFREMVLLVLISFKRQYGRTNVCKVGDSMGK